VGAGLGVGYSYLFHANRRKKQLLSDFVRAPAPPPAGAALGSAPRLNLPRRTPGPLHACMAAASVNGARRLQPTQVVPSCMSRGPCGELLLLKAGWLAELQAGA